MHDPAEKIHRREAKLTVKSRFSPAKEQDTDHGTTQSKNTGL